MIKLKNRKMLYILVSSLFYPAILGALFYLFLNDLLYQNVSIFNWLYWLASIGIIVSFSIDYLYTVILEKEYTVALFIIDIVVITLLFISYNILIQAIKNQTDAKIFYLCFIAIHALFTIWDLFFIKKELWEKNIIIYDIIGTALSIIAYIFLPQETFWGVVFLWIITILYITIGLSGISRKVKNAN
jgi:hypothetical protein